MAYLLLVLAGLCEIVWAIGLKYTDGFTRLGPSIFTIVMYALSIYLLGLAMRGLPVGTAYAIWVGIGAVGTVLVAAVLFDEPIGALKAASLALVLVGLVGLKIG